MVSRSDWSWLFVTCLLLAVASVTSYRARAAQVEVDETKGTVASIEEAYAQSLLASNSLLGRTLVWPESLTSVSGTEDNRTGPALILSLSDLSCNVCEEAETKFASEISAQAPAVRVIAVVHANQRRYVTAYARVNAVRFPVLFDPQKAFAKANQIPVAPMVMFVDAQGTIRAAHFPIPGKTAFSNVFHTLIKSLISRSASAG